MPNLTPVSSFDNVPELETTTLALGGPGGPMNLPAQALLNRTQWLKDNALASTAGPYAAGAGTANACAATYTPAITSLADGLKLRFDAVAANTGPATFAPNAITAAPILGQAGLALQGGEIAANGEVEVTWNAAQGAWVMTGCAGSAVQVADASASHHAASKGQLDAVSAVASAAAPSADLASSSAGKGASLVYDAAKSSDLASAASGKGSTLVGLKRSDLANAVATTVVAAFNSAVIEVVRDYGFDASGASDNAAKLALLLTDVQKNVDGRGRRIRFAAGNYKFNSSMAFTAYATGLVHNIVLEGDSAGSTVLDFSGCAAGTDGVTFDAGAHITMRDLEITGATRDGLVFGRGLTVGGATYVTNVSVERVRVQNSGRHNLNITNTYLASFRDSWFKAAAANNVNIGGFSTSLQFDRCEASESSAGLGWSINGAIYSTFNSCGSDSNNQQGYALSNCRGVVFNGCGAESNGKDSFLLFTSTASTTGIPASAQDIHGVVFNGCFTLTGSTSAPGTYATGWNATTADSRPIEFSLIGCSSHYSSSSERALILTGGSGQVTCVKDLYDDSSFTTADSRTGSYEVQNRSMAGRRALAVTSVAQTLTTGVQATMVLASLAINDMGATLSGNAIVIPRGVNKVRVTGSISWATNATGSRYIEIDKNGAAFIGMPVSRIPGLSSTLIQSVTSAVISVVPGDTLSLAAVQDSGGNLNINASSNFTFLCVEAVN